MQGFIPPEFLLHPPGGAGDGRVATRGETLALLADAVRGAGPEEFPALLPRPPRERGFGWALGVAEMLCDLQDLLGEAGLSFGPDRSAFAALISF